MLCFSPIDYANWGFNRTMILMSISFGSYGEMNKGYTAADERFFIESLGNQTSIFHKETPSDEAN